MKQRCFVGIDVGLTAAKASAFDTQGREIATETKPNPRTATGAGVQEVDMLALWSAVQQALAALSTRLEASNFSVLGVGVTGHGNGLYMVDENLEPVRSGIPSTDTRCEAFVSSLDSAAVEAMRQATGSRPWSSQTGVLVRWVADNEPNVYARARWVMLCKDWITSRLTGKPSTDSSDTSAAGLIELRTGQFSSLTRTALGLDTDFAQKIPPISAPDGIVGEVTEAVSARIGIPADTPVIAGSIDVVSAPIGAGSTEDGDVSIISGTWGINSVVHELAESPPDVTLNALFNRPGRVLSQEDAPTSMGNLEWLANTLRAFGATNVTPKNIVTQGLQAEPGARGLIYLPFIYGSPRHRGATGTLLGISAHHTAADVARAYIEGITFFHYWQILSLKHEGVALTESPWTLAGGGARNPAWAQIFADVMGQPMQLQTESELGARGVALMSASATNSVDVATWIGHAGKSERQISPGEHANRYGVLREEFGRALMAMSGWWRNQAH